MMDAIVPGGVSRDASEQGTTAIAALLPRCAESFEEVVRDYDDLPSLQDRTVTTGIVRPDLARRFAAGGFVGRACGRACDLRAIHPYSPYEELEFTPALRHDGDVDARVWVRIDEVRSSLSLIRQMLRDLRPGAIAEALPPPQAGEAVAMVESFRGDVLIALRLDAAGKVANFHARDPSWFQWPLLEAAIEGNIVADFPICNKSFNCSYSGHDV
jgi:Ni,Fe-hydrogenase III large subunit